MDKDAHHHEHHHELTHPIPVERQATCPVTGDIVDMQEAELLGHVREYEGKKYYFCCSTCVHLFDANPGDYAVEKNPV